MKKKQLKALNALIERFESLKSQLDEATEPLTNDLGDAKTELASLHDEIEQDFDALSERSQENDRGQALQKSVSDLNDADQNLEDALDRARECSQSLEEAIEAMRSATGEES